MAEEKQIFSSVENFKVDKTGNNIEGYLAMYGKVDDRPVFFKEGLFDNALKEIDVLPMLWQHNNDDVIGVWDDFSTDKKGLFVKGRFADTEKGGEAKKLAYMKAITGLSAGIYPTEYELDEKEGYNVYSEAELLEGSVVTVPAIKKARISNVFKAREYAETLQNLTNNEIKDIKSFEKFLRSAGFSQRQAKQIASSGFKEDTGSVREVLQGVDEKVSSIEFMLDEFLTTIKNGSTNGNKPIKRTD